MSEDRREAKEWRAVPALSFSRHCSSNAAAACSSAALSAGEATAAGISGEVPFNNEGRDGRGGRFWLNRVLAR